MIISEFVARDSVAEMVIKYSRHGVAGYDFGYDFGYDGFHGQCRYSPSRSLAFTGLLAM